MEVNEKDILLIEKYIDGQLKGEALKEFEDRLLSEQALQNALRFRKEFPELMKEASEYSSVKAEVSQALKANRPNWFNQNKALTWAVAASVILLAGIFMLMQFILPPSGKETGLMAEGKDTEVEVLSIDTPEAYSKLAIAGNGILLTAPESGKIIKMGEPVILTWKSELKDSARLVLLKNGKTLVFETYVALEEGTFTLEQTNLDAGRYAWYINDTLTRSYFVIE